MSTDPKNIHALSLFHFYTKPSSHFWPVSMPKTTSKKIPSRKIIMIAIGVLIIAALGWMFFKPKAQQPQYISAEVSRGDIEDSVLATGVLEATKMVSVGAQVSGQVKKMYV